MPDGGEDHAPSPTFGALLRFFRAAANVTQEELASRAGLSVHTISMLERGVRQAPRASTIDLLARALGLDVAQRGELIATRSSRTPSADPHPAGPGLPGPPVGAGVPAVPRQLPASVRRFTGRGAEMAALTGLLNSPVGGGAVRMSVIVGMAGVGKTALAVRWAHQMAGEFPDGQLFANLRGYDGTGTPVSPPDAIRGFLAAFAVGPERIPPDPDAQAALYRSVVAGKRILIVLDNARDVAQVRPLLPGSSSCLVMITSRHHMIGLVAGEGAVPVHLDLLTDREAQLLLSRMAGRDRVAAQPTATAELIDACGRLPLALTITAAQAAVQPGLTLAELATALREAGSRLAAFETGDAATSVRAVFSWSYDSLTAPAARMFRLLGLHPGPDISLPAAASLAGRGIDDIRHALEELTQANLVVAPAGGRFELHDLLRAYALEQSRRHDTSGQRRAAMIRVLDHYTHTAHAAALLFQTGRRRLDLGPVRRGVSPEKLGDRAGALAWFDAERPALLAAVAQAARDGLDRYVWQIPWALGPFLDRQGYWQDWAESERHALAAALRLGDLHAQAHTHDRLCHLYGRIGADRDAYRHLRASLRLYGRVGDRVGEAWAHMSAAWHLDRRDAPREALEHTSQAADLFRAAGDRAGQIDALGSLGWLHAKLGDYEQGLAYCEQARDLYRDHHNPLAEAATWDSIGYINHKLGRYARAVTCFERSLALLEHLDDRLHRAEVRVHLGDVHHAAGDMVAARDVWQRALVSLDGLHHPDAEQVRAKLAELDIG